MNSTALPSFWNAYKKLESETQRRAQKAFRLWVDNPFHPSLHFKCINAHENIWSVRISLDISAIGIWEEDDFTWFWIGSHDDYKKYFG